MPQQDLFEKELGQRRLDQRAIIGNLAEVIVALDKNSRKTTTITKKLKESSSILASIQRLQEDTYNEVSKFTTLFGKNDTAISIKKSLFGRFISDEMKRQLSSALNVKDLGGGGRGIFGAALTGMLGKGASGIFRVLLGSLLKNPFILGTAAAIGGLAYLNNKVGQTYTEAVGGRENAIRNTDMHDRILAGDYSDFQKLTEGQNTGSKTEYADLSAFKDRGSRNINPGNVKGSDYLGQVGRDEKGHAIFATKEAGVAGIVDRLYRYNKDKEKGDGLSGKKTIREIMYTYAPPSDNNNTERYIASISKNLGISPDQQIDFKKNPELLKPFVKMIMRNESPGVKAYSEAEIDKGIEIGADRALLGKEAAREKHQAYLTPRNNTIRRAGEQVLADSLGENLKGDLNENLFAATQNAQGRIRYGYGSKNIKSGSIDCSGWVQTALKKARAPDNVVQQVVGKSAAAQVIDTGKSTGTLKATNSVLEGNIKEGQLIGVRNNTSRQGNIGHVGIIVRNPETGELGVSHSSSSKGVVWQPLATFQRNFGKYGFYTSDPLVASREIKEDEKQREESQKQTTALASNTKQGTTEIASALSGTAPESIQSSTQGFNEPIKVSSPEVSTASIDNTSSPKNNLLADNTIPNPANEDTYKQASSLLGNQDIGHKLFESKKKNEAASILPLSSSLSISGSRVTADGLLLQSPVNKQEKETKQLKPAPRTIAARTQEKPISGDTTSTQTIVQPIVIQQKQTQPEKPKESITAGNTLPTVVDSPTVLAFQIDPTTPVHA